MAKRHASQASAPGRQSDTPIIGRTDKAHYQPVARCHEGTGEIFFLELLNHEPFDSNFLFVHRAEIPSKVSIGEHRHRNMEEMYFIFNGVAQFTVNGVTGELPGPCCVLCPRGSSHGLYNATEETIQFLNVAVSDVKGVGDALDFGEDLAGKTVTVPVPFCWAPLEPRLLRPSSGCHGGTGDILYRRLWSSEAFKTEWLFCDHCVLKPDTSIGYHRHNVSEEIYYLVSGRGLMTVNDQTFEVGPGDAVPCTLHSSHGLYNSGTEDILLVVSSCAVQAPPGDRVTNWGDDLSGRRAQS